MIEPRHGGSRAGTPRSSGRDHAAAQRRLHRTPLPSTLGGVTTPDPRPAGTPGDPLAAGPPYTAPSTPPTTTPGVAPATGSAPTAPQQPPAAPAPTRHTGRTVGRTLAAALLVAVTVLLVLFVMFNTQTVDISLVFTDIEAPLVVALLVAAALGGLVVAFASLLRRARRSR